MFSFPKGSVVTTIINNAVKTSRSLRPLSAPLSAKPPITPAKRIQPSTPMPKQGLLAVTGINGATSQVRFYFGQLNHNDWEIYRRPSRNDKTNTAEEEERFAFRYTLAAGSAAVGIWGGKLLVNEVLGYIDLDKATVAAGVMEFDVGEIEEGTGILSKWRGLPIFIRHRTQEEIDLESQVDLLSLRDPQHDLDRSERPDFIVLLGICTHLGCIPLSEQGDYAPGGYYCPCHGSHYDTSGRIRKGPAPLNLEVPPHYFKNDTTLIIG